MIRHIIKQYNISSTELFSEYTLTIKQHKSHAKLQTKIAKKYRQKRRTVHRSEQEPTWQVPLFFLLLFKIHTQMLQHKARQLKKKQQLKIYTEYLKLAPT